MSSWKLRASRGNLVSLIHVALFSPPPNLDSMATALAWETKKALFHEKFRLVAEWNCYYTQYIQYM